MKINSDFNLLEAIKVKQTKFRFFELFGTNTKEFAEFSG
jgi:hypothetical protein